VTFPDAGRAVASREKICGYLLNRDHPVGGPKVEWFASLGYTVEFWEDLRADLLRIARTCEDFSAVSSPFGVKYLTQGTIGHEGYGTATVVIA
jgi:hypothetical protein